MILIAIPFYKNTAFLKETLLSVLEQTSLNWQTVVFDDSTDSTEAEKAQAIIRELGDSRVQYLRNASNLGMANNWNQGLELGRKLCQKNPDLIATVILHADDRLKPRYIEKMERALKEHPEAVAIFCKTEIINEEGQRTFSFADFYKSFLLPKRQNHKIVLQGIEGIKPLVPGNFIFCPSLCYRNGSFSRLFDPNLRMVTDFELTLDLLLQRKTLVGLYEDPLFEYRRHSQNTTQLLSQNLGRFQEEKNLYRALAEKLSLLGETSLAKEAGKMRIVKKNLLFLSLTSLFRGNLRQFWRYWGFLKTLGSD